MLHKFFEPGDWFAPKKFGYGAGLPIAWQGWVLLLGYLAFALGLGLFVASLGDIWALVSIALMILSTIPFMMIVKRRTKGGWKWRG